MDPYDRGPALAVVDERAMPIRRAPVAAPLRAVRSEDQLNGRADEQKRPVLDDLEELAGPPLAGKEHPAHAMDDAILTLDDSDRVFRHHPNDSVGEGFSYDPDSADAAADFAGDLGAEFLAGASSGRDMSDLHMSDSDNDDNETPYLIEEVGENGEDVFFSVDEQSALEDDSLERPASRIRPRSTQ
jgi:hypothetical protein